MATATPYARIVGACKFYLAAASTAEPAVNTTPGAGWTELGPTNGDQSIGKDAKNEYLYDNDHTGPVKGITPQEDVMIKGILVGMTQEHFERIIASVALITTAAGPPAVSRAPLKSGYIPTEYALLMKGEADSPYGNYPAQTYIPRGTFERTFEITRGKSAGSAAALAFEYHVLEDDTQASDFKMGWSTAQTS